MASLRSLHTLDLEDCSSLESLSDLSSLPLLQSLKVCLPEQYKCERHRDNKTRRMPMTAPGVGITLATIATGEWLQLSAATTRRGGAHATLEEAAAHSAVLHAVFQGRGHSASALVSVVIR